MRSEWTGPGLVAIDDIFRPCSSHPSASARRFLAPCAAVYGARNLYGRCSSGLSSVKNVDIVTILDPSPMMRSASLDVQNVPVRCIATASANSARSQLAKHVTGPDTPALLTSMSSLVPDLSSSSNMAETAAPSATSTPSNTRTVPPQPAARARPRSDSAASSSGALRRPSMTRFAPSDAYLLATARPIPVPPPVTMTVLFSKACTAGPRAIAI